MKTKEELTALSVEIEALGRKLAELNEEELAEVTGGAAPSQSSDAGEGTVNPRKSGKLEAFLAYRDT